MKMINRFVHLANLVSSNRKNPSLIKKWKIQHRKYEILSELKNKTEFSAQDIYNYTWVANYPGKYFKIIPFPDGFTIHIVSKFVRIEFDKKDVYPKFIISINGNGNKPNDIEIVYRKDMNYHYFLSYDKIDTSEEEIDRPLFNILKELFIYTTSAVIDRVIKGE